MVSPVRLGFRWKLVVDLASRSRALRFFPSRNIDVLPVTKAFQPKSGRAQGLPSGNLPKATRRECIIQFWHVRPYAALFVDAFEHGLGRTDAEITASAAFNAVEAREKRFIIVTVDAVRCVSVARDFLVTVLPDRRQGRLSVGNPVIPASDEVPPLPGATEFRPRRGKIPDRTNAAKEDATHADVVCGGNDDLAAT